MLCKAKHEASWELKPVGLFLLHNNYLYFSRKSFISEKHLKPLGKTPLKTFIILFKMKKSILLFAALLITLSINSQGNKNLAELLGYPRDSKLLIIHADDMGLAHSVNLATIKAFDNKGITSGSIMVPCP